MGNGSRYFIEHIFLFQIVTSSYTDLQDYTYYFVPAPWLSVKLLRLLQNYPPPGLVAFHISGAVLLFWLDAYVIPYNWFYLEVQIFAVWA